MGNAGQLQKLSLCKRKRLPHSGENGPAGAGSDGGIPADQGRQRRKGLWKTLWKLCITCCTNELSANLCEPVEQKRVRKKDREPAGFSPDFCQFRRICRCAEGRPAHETRRIRGRSRSLRRHFAGDGAKIRRVIIPAPPEGRIGPPASEAGPGFPGEIRAGIPPRPLSQAAGNRGAGR